MGELTHISLFAGIGGVDLATEWAGFRTILFVEIDEYCQKVLKKHWLDVPIIGDVKDVTRERIQEVMADTQSQYSNGKHDNTRDSKQPQEISELGDSRGARYGAESTKPTIPPVTLITGGFPCQPVSTAGKRRGTEDDRWLWPEMFRVISEVRPTWVVAENVTGLLTMGFYDCLADLEGQGYETIPFVIPACAVNAPHRRDRIFIVANNDPSRCNDGRLGRKGIQRGDKPCCEAGTSGEDVADSSIYGLEGRIQAGYGSCQAGTIIKGGKATRGTSEGRNWWAVEPELGRVAYGIPNRVDRLRCLGNAVVPQQIYPILKAIADIETPPALCYNNTK